MTWQIFRLNFQSVSQSLPGFGQSDARQAGQLEIECFFHGFRQSLVVTGWRISRRRRRLAHSPRIVLSEMSTGVKCTFLSKKQSSQLNTMQKRTRRNSYATRRRLEHHVEDLVVNLIVKVLRFQQGPIDGAAHDSARKYGRSRRPRETGHQNDRFRPTGSRQRSHLPFWEAQLI